MKKDISGFITDGSGEKLRTTGQSGPVVDRNAVYNTFIVQNYSRKSQLVNSLEAANPPGHSTIDDAGTLDHGSGAAAENAAWPDGKELRRLASFFADIPSAWQT